MHAVFQPWKRKYIRFSKITQISGIFLGEQRTINLLMCVCMVTNAVIGIDMATILLVFLFIREFVC